MVRYLLWSIFSNIDLCTKQNGAVKHQFIREIIGVILWCWFVFYMIALNGIKLIMKLHLYMKLQLFHSLSPECYFFFSFQFNLQQNHFKLCNATRNSMSSAYKSSPKEHYHLYSQSINFQYNEVHYWKLMFECAFEDHFTVYSKQIHLNVFQTYSRL